MKLQKLREINVSLFAAGCRSDGECKSDESCVKNQCRDPCASDTACGLDAKCRVVVHQKQCFCPLGFQGDPLAACRRVESPCLADADCPRGQECANKRRCRPLCASDNDCSFTERCVNNFCVRECLNFVFFVFIGGVCIDFFCFWLSPLRGGSYRHGRENGKSGKAHSYYFMQLYEILYSFVHI